jgi:hypothetical protein
VLRMSEPISIPASAIPAAAPSPAEELSRLWQQGQRPDVRAFLAGVDTLRPQQLAAVLLVDLRQRWQHGERVGADDHLRAYPALRADPEAALDLIYGEYLLRQEHGEAPSLSAFGQRFPEHAERLRVQVQLRQAVDAAGADTDLGGTASAGGAAAGRVQAALGEWPSIPGYAIEGVLGRGGMGVVYKARQLGLNRLVALKLLRWGPDSTAEERARFRGEAEAIARLQHPNVVQIYEVGEQDGRPFLSLEFLPGGSLARRLDGTPRPAREAALLVQTLAGPVHAIHRLHIVHRDLKPDNVLLTADGTPKVADFGLAKLLDGNQGQTESGAALGTPSYMAPEQAQGQRRLIGPATDVYALGAVLYELLTGRPPFRGETPIDTVFAVIKGEPVPPSRLNPKLPRDLETICLKCLQKDPHRRYASAAALADDLGRFLNGRSVTARPVSAMERAWRWGRRNPGWATALASTAGFLLVITVGATLSAAWFAEERSKAQAAEKNALAERQTAVENQQRAEKAEGQAKEEAAIAQAVNEFLRKLLGRADIRNQPRTSGAVERKPNLTVRELLDRAAQSIGGKFAEQPLTESAIRLTLGNTYLALGCYDEAQQHLERSVQLRTIKLGADHPDTLTAKDSLALLYQAQGKHERAEALYREVLAASIVRLGADHPDTLTSKNNLAFLFRAQGKYERAETLYREVLAARLAKLGADNPDTLTSKNNLAVLYRAQGKYDRAETLYREVIDTRTTKLGADHPDTLRSKNNLAILYRVQAKYDRAESLYQEVIAVRLAKLGADHPSTLESKNSLAVLYHAQRKYNRAEPLFRKVLAARTTKLGADHPNTLSTKGSLALVYKTQGKYDRAERLYQEVLDAQTVKLGADHPDTLTSKNNLAVLYYAQRKYDRAETLYREVIDTRTTKLGADHPDTLATRDNLAGLYYAQGKYDRAEKLFLDVIRGRSARLGADHPDTLRSKYNLAGLYIEQGKYDRAAPLSRDAIEGTRQKLGIAHKRTQQCARQLVECYEKMGQPAQGEPLLRELADFWKQKAGADSPRYAFELAALGLNLLAQQKFADAEPLLRDSLAIRVKTQPDFWTTFNNQSQLGGSLLGQQKYADAEPLLVQGYEGMKQRETKIPASSKTRLAEALERLVRLYDETGQKDKANEWRKKLERRSSPSNRRPSRDGNSETCASCQGSAPCYVVPRLKLAKEAEEKAEAAPRKAQALLKQAEELKTQADLMQKKAAVDQARADFAQEKSARLAKDAEGRQLEVARLLKEVTAERRQNEGLLRQSKEKHKEAEELLRKVQKALDQAVLKLRSENAEDRLKTAVGLARLGKAAIGTERALCEVLLMDPVPTVIEQAADALEKIRPDLSRHVLTLMLPPENANFQGYAGASAMDKLKPVKVGQAGRRRLRRAYTLEEFGRLLKAARPRRQIAYKAAAYSGIRRGELARLQKQDCTPVGPRPRWHVRATVTKNGMPINLPMTPECAEALRAHWECLPSPTSRLLIVPDKVTFKEDLKRAKIAPVDERGRHADFHSLRYLFCWLCAQKFPIEVVAKLMRHGSLNLTTAIYLDLGLDRDGDAGWTLPPLTEGGPPPRAKRGQEQAVEEAQGEDLKPAEGGGAGEEEAA